jgi:archaellum biogenesis ATPase FlaH
MEDEIFRRRLIEILRTSKLYYVTLNGEYVEYYEEDNKKKRIDKILENIRWLRSISILSNSLIMEDNIPTVSEINILYEEEKKLSELNNIKTISINKNSSLEDIANEIKKMYDYEEYNYISEDTKIYELKQAKQNGVKYTLNYIRKK